MKVESTLETEIARLTHSQTRLCEGNYRLIQAKYDIIRYLLTPWLTLYHTVLIFDDPEEESF